MSSMLSLLDALPRHERVSIGSGEIRVFGLSGEDIGAILARFPNAFEQIYANSGQIMNMDPELTGALLAASQRNGEDKSYLGNAKVEHRARSLGMGDQLNIMKALGRCTFPDGVGPFLDDLALVSSTTNEAIEVIVKVASKATPTESPLMRKPSAPPETPPSGK